ncbi:MAG: hypothetical protein GXP34_13395 [Actinobacteria bacterium]|nr:hypothetical protein [Actinomycetota bacterium]
MAHQVGAGTNTGLSEKASISVRIAKRLFAIISWGLPAEERQRLLAERSADLDAQAEDPDHAGAIVSRALRSIPSDLRYRITADNLTTIPTGAAFAIMGIGAIILSLSNDASTAYNWANTANGVGLFIVAATLIHSPRTLAVSTIRYGTAILTAGTTVAAIDLRPPAPELFDTVIRVALGLAALGFLIFTLTSLTKHRNRRVFELAGITLSTGGVTLFAAEAAHAIGYVTHNPLQAVATFTVSAGALLAANLVVRLRHLPIT